MKIERLGQAGPLVSRLGIGGWQAGGTGAWGAGAASVGVEESWQGWITAGDLMPGPASLAEIDPIAEDIATATTIARVTAVTPPGQAPG